MPSNAGNSAANCANFTRSRFSRIRPRSLIRTISRGTSTITSIRRWTDTGSVSNTTTWNLYKRLCQKRRLQHPSTSNNEDHGMSVRSTVTSRPDILLANPLFISKDPVEKALMTPYFPLGLLYLASTLRQHDYSVAVFDGAFEPDYDSFEQAMIQYQPKIVGVTALITTRNNALKLAEIARKHGAYVIFGGPDPTGKPDAYLRHIGANGQRVVD